MKLLKEIYQLKFLSNSIWGIYFMSKEKREIVLPSQILGDINSHKAGRGTFIENGKIYSGRLGVLSKNSKFINVIPLKGKSTSLILIG